MCTNKIFKSALFVVISLFAFLKVEAASILYDPGQIAQFEKSDPHSCVGCNLSGWEMRNSEQFVYGGNYSYTNLRGAILDNSSIFYSLSGGDSSQITNLQYSDFSNSTAQNASIGNFLSSDFSNSNFNGVRYTKTDLRARYIRNSTFRNAVIRNASLYAVDIYGLDFTNAELTNMIFAVGGGDDSDFTHADLSGISIRNYTPSVKCNLTQANFTDANLTNARINDCSLSHANFKGANLSGASIINGNLCRANISEDQLASMKSLTGTIAPDCKTIY